MKAKTIFLNDLEQVIIYEANFHQDNHHKYLNKYYQNLQITDYIPILLTRYNNCVIELESNYCIGVVYLPLWLSDFQKQYFKDNKKELDKYTIYLNNYSLLEPIPTIKLLSIVDNMPKRKGDYN